MSEKLESTAPLGLGNMASWLRLGTVRDEHGNSTRGTVLQCADGQRHRLTYRQWNELHAALTLPAIRGLLTLQFDGDMPLGGSESPLQAGCRALALHPNRPTTTPPRQ